MAWVEFNNNKEDKMNECEKCENCRFAIRQKFPTQVGEATPTHMYCRRFPPSPSFPMVGKNDWCGEFKEKDDEQRYPK